MNIENLEVSILKTSEIKDGDTLLVKLTEEQKEAMTKESASALYNKIKSVVGPDKKISIFFFPSSMEISAIRDTINTVRGTEISKELDTLEQAE
jgi:hypothetical protein